MGNVLELAKKEMLRKEILMICKSACEMGCSSQVIHCVAAKMELSPKEADIDSELYYLQEKQLLRLEKKENRRLGIHRDIYFITGAGIDYLDGAGPDIPGIGG